MKQYAVKDLMVPISEYATVPEGSTVLEAVIALEKAQEDFDHTRYKHRAVLINYPSQVELRTHFPSKSELGLT